MISTRKDSPHGMTLTGDLQIGSGSIVYAEMLDPTSIIAADDATNVIAKIKQASFT